MNTTNIVSETPITKFTLTEFYKIGGVALGVYILDLLTKFWAVYYLKEEAPIWIIPNVFRFVYGENTGIAFGMFQQNHGILQFASPLAFAALIYFVYKFFAENHMDFWFRLLFGLLIGGALGNILNRMYLGYVIDFIDVFIGTYNWPTFNIADSALCTGEAILVWKLLFGEESHEIKSQEGQENQ